MAVNPVQLEWWSFSEITSQIIKCFRKRDDIKKKATRARHFFLSYSSYSCFNNLLKGPLYMK